MKNDFVILYVLVCGILLGAVVHGTISRQKYKSDARGKVQVESVYDSRFHGFEWKGHKYLRYSCYDTHAYNTILHDPDCPCWTNRLETLR